MCLYGKDNLIRRLESIAAGGRLPHAILLYGEQGAGRRTAARHTAKLMLCGSPPCGNCAQCRRIDEDTHPDIIFVKRLGEGKYIADKNKPNNIREIMDSVVIKPNDGDIKLYIFEDCDDMNVQCQNTLLKVIEEPPQHARFIFTCENMQTILETIRSRVTEFEVTTPTVQECAQALSDMGTDSIKSQELAEAMSGNIGKCIQVLNGEGDTALMDKAKTTAAALAQKSGYLAAASLSSVKDRAEYVGTLNYLTSILRDGLAIRCGAETMGFAKNEARALAGSFSEQQLLSMLDTLMETTEDCALNPNLALSSSYLISKML